VPDEFHISSLVVHCRRENAADVATALRAMDGMEVHGGVPEGKLVVTLETTAENEIVERLNQVQLLAGVLAATLVFHQFEPT
jgi:nitrate reductase NapD